MSGRLILTHGLPGCGKSTWAKTIASENPNIAVVERDDIRTKLFGKQYHQGQPSRKHEKTVTEVQKKLINDGLARGKIVIISDTNLNPAFLSDQRKLAESFGAEFSQKHFDVPIEECLRRNKVRGERGDREVPEEVIRGMASKAYDRNGHLKQFRVGRTGAFAYSTSGTPNRDKINSFNETAHSKNPIGDKLLFNFDLDGTLVETREISDKYMSGKKKDFDGFHKAAEFVPSNPEVLKIMKNAQSEGYAISITTARSDDYFKETSQWLINNDIPVSVLYMRNAGDYRSDEEVKTEMILEAREAGYEFAHAVDDNPKAIRAFKNQGIRVTEVPYHEPIDGENDYLEPVQVADPFGAGVCIRCGKPFKGSGTLGPSCRLK